MTVRANHLPDRRLVELTVSNFECDAALRLHDRTRGRVPATVVLPTRYEPPSRERRGCRSVMLT
ncbi:hypothetical protein C5C07_08510 [Haloferax sp. Atlit-4N]|uniref:Uncharacterized protein n=1 Tax=Haloferax gibbonsii (strain ATCC 33959 / DSM 4427 / JCM 8863 / NBRC 102184 / NCIMB 2188 / Ma 2.38) TaxID=1227459 RepID=M0GZP1_HALGM|nr:hypothetical protein C454_14595 [Haloferax gibbonsii ATCC 33959]RDZ55541.1 hypothetical protein C5C07_08510 [Haloferax sp. Atlit-4N]